jgi:2-methylisocitrate lyase-like PEP mutase family enzyme
MEQRTRLRDLLHASDPLVAPGVYDALSARLVERAKFKAAMISGAGVAASVLGVPDLGLLTMSEVLAQTRNIVTSTSIPIIADCDTGYGNAINVRRTVQEFESAGVACLFIEDQVTPKRCGHFEGKQIITRSEMVRKIEAACEARSDPELLIMARTDAILVAGLDEAISRGRDYAAAGADMLFFDSPGSREDLINIPRQLADLDVPLMVNMGEGSKTPLLSIKELATMGYSLIAFSGSLQKAGIKAMQGLLEALTNDGSVDGYYPERMVSLGERSELLGLDDYYALEERYLAE